MKKANIIYNESRGIFSDSSDREISVGRLFEWTMRISVTNASARHHLITVVGPEYHTLVRARIITLNSSCESCSSPCFLSV